MPEVGPFLYPDRLSEHFTFAELTRTDVRKYLEENRKPPPGLVEHAGRPLCETLLEPIREHFGAPLVIHSGYRCGRLNNAIGGSQYSQHMAFQAADFHVAGHTLEEVWTWIWRESGLAFGQLILEGWSAGMPSWLHLSLGAPWRPAEKCGQVLTYDGRHYVRRDLP